MLWNVSPAKVHYASRFDSLFRLKTKKFRFQVPLKFDSYLEKLINLSDVIRSVSRCRIIKINEISNTISVGSGGGRRHCDQDRRVARFDYPLKLWNKK